MEEFIGITTKSESKNRGYGDRVTLVEIANSSKDKKVTIKQFSIPGQHRINRNEFIKVKYRRHTEVNWVNAYSIFDGNDQTIYTSTCY